MNQNAKRPRTVKIPTLVIWEDGDLTQVNPNQLIYPVLAKSRTSSSSKITTVASRCTRVIGAD